MPICPNKNLPEWKALENAVGEFEAYKVFLAFDNDVPNIFAETLLNKKDIKAIAGLYTNTSTKEDVDYLERNMPLLQNIIRTTNKTIDKGKTTYDTITEDILYGLNSTNPSQKIDAINAVLKTAENMRVPIMFEEFGDSPVLAAANFTKGVIAVTENIEKRPDAWAKMPEEVTHWWYRLMSDDAALKKELWSFIGKDNYYEEILGSSLEEYKKKYPNLNNSQLSDTLKEEAIGQAVALVIQKISDGTASFKHKNVWEKILDFFRKILNKPIREVLSDNDPFVVAASRVLNSDLTDLVSYDEYMAMVALESNYLEVQNQFASIQMGETIPTVINVSDYASKLLSTRYKKRTRYLTKTLEKIQRDQLSTLDRYDEQGRLKTSDTKGQKNLYIEKVDKDRENVLKARLNLHNVNATLASNGLLLKKYKNNPVPLKGIIKLDGAKKQELGIYKAVQAMILEENPELKSISAPDFINEVQNWLEAELTISFTNEIEHLTYRVGSTFKNPNEVQHDKIGIRFDNEFYPKGQVGNQHFTRTGSPAAWGNLTPFDSDGTPAVLMHEIQNDFYQELLDLKKLHGTPITGSRVLSKKKVNELKNRKNLDPHTIITHLKYDNTFVNAIDKVVSHINQSQGNTSLLEEHMAYDDLILPVTYPNQRGIPDLDRVLAYDVFKERLEEQINLNGIINKLVKDSKEINEDIDDYHTAISMLKDIGRRKNIKLWTTETITEYKKQIREYKDSIDGNEYDSLEDERDAFENAPDPSQYYNKEVVNPFIAEIKKSYKLPWNVESYIRSGLSNPTGLYNAGYNNSNYKFATKKLEKNLTYIKIDRNQLFFKIKRAENLQRMATLSFDEYKSVMTNIIENIILVEKMVNADFVPLADETYEEKAKRKQKDDEEIERFVTPAFVERDLGYFTPLVHHLIQTHITQHGKETPLYFSGKAITLLSQGSEATSNIYAGPEEVKAGIAEKVGPLFPMMKKIKGIKLEYLSNIPGFINTETGGYKINLDNYHYKHPLLYSLEKPTKKEKVIEKESVESKRITALANISSAASSRNSPIKEKESYQTREQKEVSQAKISHLSSSLGVTVVEDNTIKAFSQIDPYEAGEIPTMRVNFSAGGLQQDTIIHEFGHIFIDALGGMSNEMLAQGRRHLIGSDVEADVNADPTYDRLSKEMKDREVLATAIGREGAKVYKMQDGTLNERFINWAKLFFNKLKKTLGIDYNVALDLANQLLNEDIKIDSSLAVGSPIEQRQAFPDAMTPIQEKTVFELSNITSEMGFTDKEKYYTVEGIEGNFQRQSRRIEELYPESKFPEDLAPYYENSRQWGNMNDMIWEGVINGENLTEIKNNIDAKKKSTPRMAPFSLSEEVIDYIYKYAKSYIKNLNDSGYAVLSQQSIYSEGTMVGGTTDILVVDEYGRIQILDNKTSSNPTQEGENYGPVGDDGEQEWSYESRGKFESYRTKHTKQLSGYKKMYEDKGFKVDGLNILPIFWSEKNTTTVTKAVVEDVKPINYSNNFADNIIDNLQQKARELLTSDSKIEEQLDEILNIIREKVLIVKAKYKEKILPEDRRGEGWYNNIKELADQMALNSNIKSLNEFIEQGIERTKTISEDLDTINRESSSIYETKIGTDVIYKLKLYSDTFSVVPKILEIAKDMETHLNKNVNLKTQTKKDHNSVILIKKIRSRLTKLDEEVNSINNTYLSLSKRILAKELARVSKWGEAEFRKKTLSEWKNNNPRKGTKLSYDAWKKIGEEWVNQEVADNKIIIANMNLKRVSELLAEAPKDISIISAWLTDQRGINDGVFQIAERMLARAEFSSMSKFLKFIKESEDVYINFIQAKKEEGVGDLNYDKLYEELYEKVINPKTGKSTGYLVGKYKNSYKIEEKKFFIKYKKLGLTPPPSKINELYTRLQSDHINPQWLELEKRRSINSSDPIVKMYDMLYDKFDYIDSITPSEISLGRDFQDSYDSDTKEQISIRQYKLPGIEKSTADRFKNVNIFEAAGQSIKDALQRDTQQKEYGRRDIDAETGKISSKNFGIKKITLDEKNRRAQFVPIHYRGTPDDQSYDLMSISMMDLNMAIDYKEKNILVPEMEMLRDILEERTITQTDLQGNVFQNFLAGAFGKRFSQTNKESPNNLFAVFQNLLTDRLYGENSVDLGDIEWRGKKISVDKISGGLMKWTANTFLMVNDVAAATAFLQGNVMNWMEAVAGTDITKTGLIKAEAMYSSPKYFAGILRDMGQRRPTGMINLLREKFNANSEFNGLNSRYGQGRGINHMDTGVLHGLQHMQEHFVQSTLMLGILHDIEITKTDGTKDTLINAYEVSENGFLEVKDGYTINEDIEFEVSSRIREVITMAHGNYDSLNKAMIQRYVLGKAAFMLRKWTIVGYEKRFRGFKRSRKNQTDEEIRNRDKFFSESLNRFEEGMYVTTSIFIRTLLREYRFLSMKMMATEADNLTPEERANVKRTFFEVGMAIASLAGSSILAGLAKLAGDDDEKDRLYYITLLLRRLFSELIFYINPIEAGRIIRSPAATMSIVEKLIRLMYQVGEDASELEFERYKKGRRKGETKVMKNLYDIMPILNQTDRDAKETYELISGDM
tara:strand:+ start:3927 stop:11690 length:7764 start_codon:yes stop_codon:yes gene_type:complete